MPSAPPQIFVTSEHDIRRGYILLLCGSAIIILAYTSYTRPVRTLVKTGVKLKLKLQSKGGGEEEEGGGGGGVTECQNAPRSVRLLAWERIKKKAFD